MQKRPASPPHKDQHDDDAEIVDAPSATSKGKQKAQPKPFNPSVGVPRNTTTQAKQTKRSVAPTPLSEKPSVTTGASKDLLKTLGEIESLALAASAEVKHAQAEVKKAEAVLDTVLSEIRSVRTKYDL